MRLISRTERCFTGLNFELRKINSARNNKPMEDWLNLINAETEGELMELETTTKIKEVRDTIVILRELNADEKVRQEAYYREKRLYDEATALNYAKRDGMIEGEAIGIAKERQETITKLSAIGMIDDDIKRFYSN